LEWLGVPVESWILAWVPFIVIAILYIIWALKFKAEEE